MKRRTHQKPIKAKVHIVIKWPNWDSGQDDEIVKVFRGTRGKAAKKWCEEQKAPAPNHRYGFSIETWEVD